MFGDVGGSNIYEAVYLAAVEGLGKCGEKAVSILDSIITKDLFKYKAAKAAAEALGATGSQKAAKPLVSLLEELDKDSGERAQILRESVQKALTALTGATNSNAEAWKEWLKNNKK